MTIEEEEEGEEKEGMAGEHSRRATGTAAPLLIFSAASAALLLLTSSSSLSSSSLLSLARTTARAAAAHGELRPTRVLPRRRRGLRGKIADDGDGEGDAPRRRRLEEEIPPPLPYYPPYGTVSGYDAPDGLDPICWDRYRLASDNNGVERARMLPTCWDGTDLNVTLLPPPTSATSSSFYLSPFSSAAREEDQGRLGLGVRSSSSSSPTEQLPYEDYDGVYYAGRTYRAVVHLKIDTSSLFHTPPNAPPNEGEGGGDGEDVAAAYFRLILCETRRVGFCHPFHPSATTGPEAMATAEDKGSGLLVADYGQIPLQREEDDKGGGGGGDGGGDGGGGGDGDGNNGTTLMWYADDVPLVLPEGSGGDYFVIGHVAMIFGSAVGNATTNVTTSKIDIADAIPFNTITLKDEPIVHSVTDPFKIAMGTVAALCFAWQCFLLLSIWRNCDHVVMRVAQAPFLALIALSGAIVAASSVFFMPLNDAFCNLRDPLVLIPSSLIGSIMVGRIWRAYWVLSQVLRFAVDDSSGGGSGHGSGSDSSGGSGPSRKFDVMIFLSVLANWDMCIPSSCRRVLGGRGRRYEASSASGSSVRSVRRLSAASRNKSLRATVTNGDLLRLITALTAPQCVLQIVHLAVYPERLYVDLNEDGTEGVTTCTTEGLWLTFGGLMLVVAVFLMSVWASWAASELPTVFNEKDSIFTASWIAVVLFVIGGVVLLTTKSLMLHPNVESLLWMLFTLCLALITSWLLIMPKLRKVWKGEQIILSSLFNADSQRNGLQTSSHTPHSSADDSRRRSSTFDRMFKVPNNRPSLGRNQNTTSTSHSGEEANAVAETNQTAVAATPPSAGGGILKQPEGFNRRRSVSWDDRIDEEKEEEEMPGPNEEEGVLFDQEEEYSSDGMASIQSEEAAQEPGKRIIGLTSNNWVSVRSGVTWRSVNDGVEAGKSPFSGERDSALRSSDQGPRLETIPSDINLVQDGKRRSSTLADTDDSDDELSVNNKGDAGSETRENGAQLQAPDGPPTPIAGQGTSSARAPRRRSVTFSFAEKNTSEDELGAASEHSTGSRKKESMSLPSALRGSPGESWVDVVKRSISKDEQSSRSSIGSSHDPKEHGGSVNSAGSEEHNETAPAITERPSSIGVGFDPKDYDSNDGIAGSKQGHKGTEYAHLEQSGNIRHRPRGKRTKKHVLNKDEAPPAYLQRHMLRTKESIQRVNEYTLNGTQPPLEMWAALRAESAKLAADLDHIDFGWTVDEERPNTGRRNSLQSAPAISGRSMFSHKSRSSKSLDFRLKGKKKSHQRAIFRATRDEGIVDTDVTP
mmetsp:Transcript_13605/g.25500  ORF Transcript_13605/g.25500 Transcript_13605/m.25500 type:complete len:1308 (-) Transcript_13605:804-4727(-)